MSTANTKGQVRSVGDTSYHDGVRHKLKNERLPTSYSWTLAEEPETLEGFLTAAEAAASGASKQRQAMEEQLEVRRTRYREMLENADTPEADLSDSQLLVRVGEDKVQVMKQVEAVAARNVEALQLERSTIRSTREQQERANRHAEAINRGRDEAVAAIEQWSQAIARLQELARSLANDDERWLLTQGLVVELQERMHGMAGVAEAVAGLRRSVGL
jgi:hypothetical protein